MDYTVASDVCAKKYKPRMTSGSVTTEPTAPYTRYVKGFNKDTALQMKRNQLLTWLSCISKAPYLFY